MRVLVQVGLVVLGSAAGGLLRWGVGMACARWFGLGFPWGTLVINLSGCVFLGWLSASLLDRLANAGIPWLTRDDLQLLLAVGFTGAYTTFSTFEYESHNLFKDGDTFKGMTYLLASVFLGLVAVRLGVLLGGGPR